MPFTVDPPPKDAPAETSEARPLSPSCGIEEKLYISLGSWNRLLLGSKGCQGRVLSEGNAFDGGPVQPRTIGLDQSVQMTKQLVWDLDQLVQHLDRLFGLLVETVCRV